MKACSALGSDNKISGAVTAVSFNDTLGDIEKIVEGDLSDDRVIPVNSIEMREVIADFGAMIASDRTTQVHTKYKTTDRKLRPVMVPLPEDN